MRHSTEGLGRNPKLVKVAEAAIELLQQINTEAKFISGISDPIEVICSPDVFATRQIQSLDRVKRLGQMIVYFVSIVDGDEVKFLKEIFNFFEYDNWKLLIKETPGPRDRILWVKEVNAQFVGGKGFEFQGVRKRLINLFGKIRGLLPRNWESLQKEGLVS